MSTILKLQHIEPDLNGFLIVRSDAAKEFVRRLEMAAGMDELHIFITGETGTGKSEFARYFHQISSRKNGPFVATSASNIEPGLLRAELFGHEKGSYTNADTARGGLLEQADKGVLFFDEIGDLSMEEQRALKFSYMEGTKIKYRRLGGKQNLVSDVRFVTAYHRSIHELVVSKEFLREVWARLASYQFKLLPLRKRKDDLSAIIHLFLNSLATKSGKKITGIRKQAFERLMDYQWPKKC